MDRNGIVVVGGGHAGASVVGTLRTEGYEGPIRLVSGDPRIPYHRPPLSKAFLKDPAEPTQDIRPAAFYDESRIDLELGRMVTRIDRPAGAVVLDDGRTIRYDGLVLATGTRVRKLGIPGGDLDGVFYLQSGDDAAGLRAALYASENVVIVGGGFIGLEVACTAAALGKTVTVLEAGPRLLGRAVSPVISQWMLETHRAAGIEVRLSVPPARFVGAAGRLVAVEPADGGTPLAADLVLVGIGVVPNVSIAQEAGLAVDDGILVDEHLRTADPAIFACGDGTAFHHWHADRRLRIESVQNANDQGQQAARNLMQPPSAYRAVPWFWSDQGATRLQIVGLSHGADRTVVRGRPEEGAFSVFHFRGERLAAIDSINRAADHMLGRRLIASGTEISPAMAGDMESDLKSLLKR